MSQTIDVNMTPGLLMPTIYYSQGDIGREFKINISSSDGTAIPAGATVKMQATKPSGLGFSVSGTLSNGVATFTTTETMTNEAGRVPAELVLEANGDRIGTANFYWQGEKDPHPQGTVDGDLDDVLPKYMTVTVTSLAPNDAPTYTYDPATNNANFGIPRGVDGELTSNVLASTYSSSSTYSVGDYVYYNGSLYRCITAITTAEAWTAGHWAQVALANDVSDLKDDINANKQNPLLFSKLRDAKVYGNLWDEDTRAYGYYNTGNNGALVEGGTTWYYSPTFIPVNVGDLILYNNSKPIVCAYDKDGVVVSCTQPGWSGYTVPNGVSFLRFSITVSSATNMYIFKDGTSQFEYKSKTKLYLPSLKVDKPVVTVDIGGAGDYTSLTKALYETADEHPDVVVYQGTYDIVAEYKALFGNTIFDTMTYETAGMKGFQWGLYIDNRTVTFYSGAVVNCDMSAYTNDASRRFSPFNLVRNAVIDGCYCYAVNPYYIVHDDFGLDTDLAFTNVIKNCVLISPEPSQGNVIGGGLKKYATKIVDNCYLDNGNNRPVTMRYHNTNYPNATPTVIIKNTRANGKIRVNCYGTQTTKMIAIVNNCQASAVEKAYEGDASTDNVNLYAWSNQTA